MSTIEQTLSAGVPATFPGAEQFHLLEAGDPVDITFYDNHNKPIETWEAMKGGFRIVFEEHFLQVKIESATGQTVKIALTSGRGEYDRSQGDVSATITKSTQYLHKSDVVVTGLAAVQLLPDDAARRVAYITNLAGNVQTMRIGGTATVAATQGTPLAPGETITIETSGAVYAYKPAAGNENIAVTWTRD